MDTPIDICEVLYEVESGGTVIFLDSMKDEVDILYTEGDSDGQIQSE